MKSFSEYLKEDKDLSDKLKEYNEPEFYFSFKPLNNLGQNKNIHEVTPYAIYCYNMKQAISYYKIKEGFSKVPFSYHEKNINIFSIPWSVKIIGGKYSESDFETDKKELLEKYSDKIEDSDKLIKDSFARYFNERIWLLVLNVAKLFPEQSKKITNIFKDLGYSGITDQYGTGFLSEKEKFLTILFDKKNVKFYKKIGI